MSTVTPPVIDPNRWYTLPQAARVLPYTAYQLRARVKLGQIKHEVIPPLVAGGRVTFKLHGTEVLRLLGAAVLDAQPQPKEEPLEMQVNRALERLAERRKLAKAAKR